MTGERPLIARRFASLRGCMRKMAADAVLLAAAWVMAFFARLDGLEPPYDTTMVVTLPVVVGLKVAILHFLGAYRSIWRYSGLVDLRHLVLAMAVAGFGVASLGFLLPYDLGIPRSVPFIDAVLGLTLIGGLRMFTRMRYEYHNSGAAGPETEDGEAPRQARRTLIVGAADTGEMVVREMLRRAKTEYLPVAFADDNPIKQVQRIHGVPVMGRTEQIPQLVDELEIDEIIIAIPSARGKTVQRIVKLCTNTPATLKILPEHPISDRRVKLSELREVQVEDLLGREPVDLDLNAISAYLRGKRILVTGAGGSIGSELCRQILSFAPTEIHLMGRGENSIYEIHEELRRSAGFTRLVQVIGDVINKKKLEGVFSRLRPEIVFHAGADKHVPLMELNPDEAVFNNIVGTRNVLDVSNAFGVERLVCVSTDKAVNPSSVMGACKRVGELLVQSHMHTETRAMAVRFANVLASRGSVIPLFQRQIRDGGPITVTDRRITRYFMTIPEAAALVIQAGALGRGGEIFVLDMGEPMKIWDLAHNLVRLAGLEPGTQVAIHEVGLRPGEKLEEELTLAAEIKEPTPHQKIICVKGEAVDGAVLLDEIETLRQDAIRMDSAAIRRGLARLIPEFGGALPPAAAAPEGAGDHGAAADDGALGSGGLMNLAPGES